MVYWNEDQVGKAVLDSGLDREDVFISAFASIFSRCRNVADRTLLQHESHQPVPWVLQDYLEDRRVTLQVRIWCVLLRLGRQLGD